MGIRSGDREAAAAFLIAYGPQIRRRIRGKLSIAMRRLFDSQEILSTVGRRLDRYVRSGHLSDCTDDQLWALIFRIAQAAIVDKARAASRLERVEGEDGEFAAAFRRRLESAASRSADGPDLALDDAFRALYDPIDREILALWLRGAPHTVTADLVGMAPTAVRKRWQSIRQRLRETALGEGKGVADGQEHQS